MEDGLGGSWMPGLTWTIGDSGPAGQRRTRSRERQAILREGHSAGESPLRPVRLNREQLAEIPRQHEVLAVDVPSWDVGEPQRGDRLALLLSCFSAM